MHEIYSREYHNEAHYFVQWKYINLKKWPMRLYTPHERKLNISHEHVHTLEKETESDLVPRCSY